MAFQAMNHGQDARATSGDGPDEGRGERAEAHGLAKLDRATHRKAEAKSHHPVMNQLVRGCLHWPARQELTARA